MFAGARHPRARPSAASCFPAEAGTSQQGALIFAKSQSGPQATPSCPQQSERAFWPPGEARCPQVTVDEEGPEPPPLILGVQRALLSPLSGRRVLPALSLSPPPLLPCVRLPPIAQGFEVADPCSPFSVTRVIMLTGLPAPALVSDLPLPLPAPSTLLGSSSNPTVLHSHIFCSSNMLSP